MKLIDKAFGINPELASQNNLKYKLLSYGAETSVLGAITAAGSIVAYSAGVQEAMNIVPLGGSFVLGGFVLSTAGAEIGN